MSEIPAHVPRTLRRGHVAKVLGLDGERVRYLTSRGIIPKVNEQHRYEGGWIEYRPEDIATFAESRNIIPNWSALEGDRPPHSLPLLQLLPCSARPKPNFYTTPLEVTP